VTKWFVLAKDTAITGHSASRREKCIFEGIPFFPAKFPVTRAVPFNQFQPVFLQK